MPDRAQKSPRSYRRSLLASKIKSFGFPAPSPCSRCVSNFLKCFCRHTGCCSECVRSGMDKKCDVMESWTDRVLREQKVALDKAMSEMLKASAKVARLQKVVRNLENKSEKEMDDLMKELENESDSGEGLSQPSDNGASPSGGVSSLSNDRVGVPPADMSWF